VRREQQRLAGAEMVWATFGSLLSPEGWLDQEAHESDLRGSRGVALAGALMIFMGLANFRHTVHPPPTRRVTEARRALFAQMRKGAARLHHQHVPAARATLISMRRRHPKIAHALVVTIWQFCTTHLSLCNPAMLLFWVMTCSCTPSEYMQLVTMRRRGGPALCASTAGADNHGKAGHAPHAAGRVRRCRIRQLARRGRRTRRQPRARGCSRCRERRSCRAWRLIVCFCDEYSFLGKREVS